MDISKETNVEKLKAMAFDCIQRLEIEQQNLRALQIRMAELEKGKEKDK